MDEIPIRARCAVLVFALCALVGPALAQQAGVDPDSAAQHASEPGNRAASLMRERRSAGAVGVSLTTIEMDSLVPRPLGTFSNVLSSRIPGALVEQPSGATGAGARIHIRGINSLLLPGDPLVIVDGVRVANTTTVSTVNVGGQAPSLLDALDPEEIERIEVLPGAASAAMYGGDAADGVILITTRRGQLGRPVWRLHTQYGAIKDVTTYPANFGRAGTNPTTGQPMLSCPLDLEQLGGCVPGPLMSWNPLENVSPFRAGSEQRHGLSASGGSRAITYYVAGDYDREDGVYADNEQLQSHARGNLTGHIGRTLDLGVSANYVDGMTRLPIMGSSAYGVIGYGLFGAAVDDSITRGYYAKSLDVAFHDMGPPERLHQYTLGFTAVWRPLGWLRSQSTIGFDRAHLSSSERLLFERSSGLPSDTTIDRTTGVYRTDELTAQSGLSASYGRADGWSATSTVGVQHHRGRAYDRQESEQQAFYVGSDPLIAETMTEMRGDASTTGVYAEQQLAWRQRLFVMGGLRRDRVYHTLMQGTGKVPSATDAWANLSWVVSSEPFFPRAIWLDQLRLRAAYGRTERYLDAVSAPPDLMQSVIGFAPTDPFGSPPQPANPTPQRTRATEVGVDAALFHGRLSGALTYYDKRSTDVALFTSISFSSSVLLQDGAAIRNHGYEMRLCGSLLQTSSATAAITLAGTTNSNSVDELNMPEYYLTRYPLTQSVQKLAPNYPASSYWGRRFTFADANGDGIISRNEVQIDSAISFLGSAMPTRELSIAPTLTLFHRVTLFALLDYRGGFKQYDANDAVRCATVSLRNCRAVYDPTAPLSEQAAAIASRVEFDTGQIDDAPYIYDADFWKLREVAITLAVPHRWAERLAASDVSLTLAGRNLATWTSYPGLDPELNATPSDPLLRGDFSTQPPVRYLMARLDVTW